MRRIYLLLSLITLISCSSTKETSHGIETEGIKVTKEVLDNGLTILISENRTLPILSYYTLYKVGGRHEGEGTTGATHFLEHMMFKGAKKYGPGMFDTTIESNGGSTNAYTNFDNTVYYENIPSTILEKIIDMEADRMDSLLLIPEAFESERNVVKEERKMRYENSPRGKLYLSMMKAVFEKTPYGGSVIGELEDLNSLSRDQVMDFFKKFYTPDNAVIVIVGDVDTDKTIAMIKDKFGKFKKSSQEIVDYKKSRDEKSLYEHKGRFNREIKLHGSSPNPTFMMALKGTAIGEKEGYINDILASVLGDGDSSILNQKYVKGSRPLLSYIGSSNYTLKYNGVFYISGQLLNNVSLSKFQNRMKKDLKKVCSDEITERTLQKVKNKYWVSFYDGIKSNAGIAHMIGLNEITYNDYSFYKKELEIYDQISLSEVVSACHKLFDKNDSIFVSIWDKHPKEKK